MTISFAKTKNGTLTRIAHDGSTITLDQAEAAQVYAALVAQFGLPVMAQTISPVAGHCRIVGTHKLTEIGPGDGN